MKADPNIEIRRLPDDVLALLRRLSREAVEELSARDEQAARIEQAYTEFQRLSQPNQRISELAYMNAREL
jgi:TRAP-type mannitol/chloroaromatic compound transport system substrate-binding protein